MTDELDGIEADAYQLIREQGGVYQSELWKALDATSRQGSRIARSLADAGFIDREEVVHEGRVTYRLSPIDEEAEASEPPIEAADLPANPDLSDREQTALAIIHGEGETFQSELWKILDVSSRTGSRIVTALNEAGLIEREEAVHDGRTTYRLLPVAKTLDFTLLMAGEQMSPLVGIDDIDPVESEAFTRWLFGLTAEDRSTELQ